MDEETDPPSIEIPDLKKKAELKAKEKKGAGAVGGGAQASSEAGLAGGSPLGSGGSALLRGASPVGAVRGGVANLLRSKFAALASGKLSAPFAALFAGKAGVLGMTLAVAAAGALAYGVIRGVARNTAAGQRTAIRFDALASTIVPPQSQGVTGGSSFAMLANAAKGLLGGMISGKKEEGKKEDEWGGDGKGAPDASEMVKGVTDGVAGMVREKGSLGEMSGSKLSSELGRSNAFGGRNVFQGGDTGFHPKQLDTALNPAGAGRGLDSSRGKQARGNLGSMRRGMAANRLSGINTRSHLTDKALGQLKFARDMSYKGAQVGGTESGSGYAADAFSGQSTTGGDGGAIGGGLGDVGGGTDPSGGGTTTGGTTTGDGDYTCPSGTTESNGTCEPDDVGGDNVSPDQSLIDMCYGLAMAAAIMILVGTILVMIGDKIGGFWGPIISAIGKILVVFGILMGLAVLVMATQMQDQGYMVEWAELGAALVGGIAGLMVGTAGIVIMATLMACALIYLGISQDKVEDTDNVDQEEVTATSSRSTNQFADLA